MIEVVIEMFICVGIVKTNTIAATRQQLKKIIWVDMRFQIFDMRSLIVRYFVYLRSDISNRISKKLHFK